MGKLLSRIVREMQFHSPIRRHVFPRYKYQMTPPQLCFLCQCVEETKNVEGSIAEIGCSVGATTVFINKFMDARHIEKPYLSIDTFSGFVEEDIDFEVRNRGKTKKLYSGFQVNSKRWYDGTMRMNGITRVKSIKADVNVYDLRSHAPLSFCLLDVDLYRPIKKALPELYDILSPGGMIVVDDCDATNMRWDGADQAYKEFVKDVGLGEQIVHGKLGINEK